MEISKRVIKFDAIVSCHLYGYSIKMSINLMNTGLVHAICLPYDGSEWHPIHIPNNYHMEMPFEVAFPPSMWRNIGKGELENIFAYSIKLKDDTWITFNFLGWEQGDASIRNRQYLPLEFISISVYGNMYIIASIEDKIVDMTREMYYYMKNSLEFEVEDL